MAHLPKMSKVDAPRYQREILRYLYEREVMSEKVKTLFTEWCRFKGYFKIPQGPIWTTHQLIEFAEYAKREVVTQPRSTTRNKNS